MADAAGIIQKIMADPKIASSRNFSANVYRDEPILIPARNMMAMTPPKILAMRRLARGIGHDARIFHTQGKFMEAYEDEYDYAGDFAQYFPTYQLMTDAQLRGYFSWRTKVRRGRIEKTSLSFAFVHIYELLNQIGADSPEAAFRALRDFWTAYRELDPRPDAYVPLWLKDFAVYHNLDNSLLRGLADDVVDGAMAVLLDCASRDADAVFSALCAVSSYAMENSPFFKKHPDDVKAVVRRVFTTLWEYHNRSAGKNADEKFFGRLTASRYAMFKSAVVYQRAPHPDAAYEVGRHHRYVCKNGQWSCERFLGYGDNNKRIGALLKTIDFLMRRRYGMNSTLQPGKTNKVVFGKVEKEILKFLEEKRASAPPRVDIDVTKLHTIRAASAVTRDRLLVEDPEEEREAEDAARTENAPPDEETNRAENASADDGLDADERRFLACLLTGRPYAEFLRSRGLMASLLVDGINDKLFDRFGDTVIVYSGEFPVVVDEYAGELGADV